MTKLQMPVPSTACGTTGLLTAFLLAFGLAGCGVMTIDVDVYKGPLANHEDVQTEQLAVMAVGARPLIERLRVALIEELRKDEGANESETTQWSLLEIVEQTLVSYDDLEPAEAKQLGRLKEGLLTFIQKFLLATHTEESQFCEVFPDCPERKTAGDLHRRELQDALVRFAQKVLFVVNHEALFTETRGKSTVNTVGNSETGTKYIGGSSTEKVGENYVEILQTVGNSILVHVDAMRQEESYKNKLKDATGREVAAIKAVFGGGAPGAFDVLVAALDSEIIALDDQITELEQWLGSTEQKLKAAEEELQQWEENNKKTPPITPEPGKHTRMIFYQHAWASLGRDPQSLDRDASDPEEQDEADREFGETLQTTVEQLADGSAEKNFEEIVNALIKERDGKKSDSTAGTTDRLTRLSNTICLFKEDKEKCPFKDDKEFRKFREGALALSSSGPDYLNNLSGLIKKNYLTHKAASQSSTNTAQASAESSNGMLKKLAKARDEARGKRDRITDELNRLKTKRADRSIAKSRLGEVRDPVLALLPAVGVLGTAESVKSRAIAELEKRANPASLLSNEYAKAAAVVRQLPVPPGTMPPGGTPSVMPIDPPGDAKEVLDGLIAQLRHQHIQEILSSTPDSSKDLKQISEQVKKLKTALALAEAFRQRADMAYIRPAIAYLRTSFTATTLQDNNLAWRDILNEHGRRSLVPLLPAYLSREKTRVISEIDKQFWQTINKVRVAGSGNTNYVIAKDDVGNWYVKNYSTNPEQIIKSVSKLALFAAGVPSVPSSAAPSVQNLVGGGGDAAGNVANISTGASNNENDPANVAAAATQPASTETQSDQKRETTLERQERLFTAKYRQRAKGLITSAKTKVEKLEDGLNAGWAQAGIKDENQEALEKAADIGAKDEVAVTLAKADLAKIKDKDAPKHLVDGLRAIRLYSDGLMAKIRARVFADQTEEKGEPPTSTTVQAETLRTKALSVVHEVVLRQALLPLVEDARRSAIQYRTELQVIGQTAD